MSMCGGFCLFVLSEPVVVAAVAALEFWSKLRRGVNASCREDHPVQHA